jgi:hypothetical protein
MMAVPCGAKAIAEVTAGIDEIAWTRIHYTPTVNHGPLTAATPLASAPRR